MEPNLTVNPAVEKTVVTVVKQETFTLEMSRNHAVFLAAILGSIPCRISPEFDKDMLYKLYMAFSRAQDDEKLNLYSDPLHRQTRARIKDLLKPE